MTFSDAWIEAGDDDAFAQFLNQKPRFSMLPPPPRPYWINHVKEWATRESLPIEYPDHGTIRVAASRAQLQSFFTAMFGAQAESDDPTTVLGYLRHRGSDHHVYAIVADEF